MKTQEHGDKDMVSNCCCSDMVEPDWDMAEQLGSMWRAYVNYICKGCGQVCEAIERDDYVEVLKFSTTNLSHIFKNINHKACNLIGYDYAWDIMKEGKFIGELYYSQEFREWFFIKDNYPMPRRSYRISFPIKTTEFMIDLFKSIDVELIKEE